MNHNFPDSLRLGNTRWGFATQVKVSSQSISRGTLTLVPSGLDWLPHGTQGSFLNSLSPGSSGLGVAWLGKAWQGKASQGNFL